MSKNKSEINRRLNILEEKFSELAHLQNANLKIPPSEDVKVTFGWVWLSIKLLKVYKTLAYGVLAVYTMLDFASIHNQGLNYALKSRFLIWAVGILIAECITNALELLGLESDLPDSWRERANVVVEFLDVIFFSRK